MSTIKIAVQKSGRLNEDSLQLLKDCGISIDNGIDQLKAAASNFPLEVLYLRNGDIPQYLRDGVVDIAIIGDAKEALELIYQRVNESAESNWDKYIHKWKENYPLYVPTDKTVLYPQQVIQALSEVSSSPFHLSFQKELSHIVKAW